MEAVKALVERGASLRTTEKGKSPLDFAIMANSLPVVDYLLSQGAEPNFDGLRNTGAGQGAPPIVRAARRGNVDILRSMLGASADVNQVGGIGQSALHTAAYYGHNPFVAALLSAGATVDAETTVTASMPNERGGKTKMWNRSTPLHLAASAGHAEVLRTLLAAGSTSLEALTGGKRDSILRHDGVFAPLHLAAESGRLAAAKVLLSAGARANVLGSNKATDFDWAVCTRNSEMMAFFAEQRCLKASEHLSLSSWQLDPTSKLTMSGGKFLLRVKLDPRHPHVSD